MRKAAIVVLAALAFGAGALPALAVCKVHTGDHVVLYSTTDDPAVLVWDSRFRLRAYHAASFDEARQLAPHAHLAGPGTRAIVESCVDDFVQSRLTDRPDDAVGIIIVSGPERGQSGWVLGSDVRGIYHPIRAKTPR